MPSASISGASVPTDDDYFSCQLMLDGRIEMVSASVAAILGFSPADLQGRMVYDIVFLEDLQVFATAFRQVIQQPALSLAQLAMSGASIPALATVFRAIVHDGTIIWLCLKMSPIGEPGDPMPQFILCTGSRHTPSPAEISAAAVRHQDNTGEIVRLRLENMNLRSRLAAPASGAPASAVVRCGRRAAGTGGWQSCACPQHRWSSASTDTRTAPRPRSRRQRRSGRCTGDATRRSL